jgi:hypothetical protein
MTRAAPTELPDELERIGDGRYAVFEPLGDLQQGSLHMLWDTRLRMWRTGLRCVAEHQPAIQHVALLAEHIRQPALLRTRDVLGDWVVLEAVDARPLEVDTPWAVGPARDAVLAVGKAVVALREAGAAVDAVVPQHLLVTDDQRLLLLPPPQAEEPDDLGAATASSLSLLLAGLVTGAPLETSYDDASALPPGLAEAHALATGHRPDLLEFLRALEAYDVQADVAARALGSAEGAAPTRAEQIATASERPSYVDDDADIGPGATVRQLEEARRQAAAAAPPPPSTSTPAAAAGAAVGGLAFVGIAVVLLGLGVPTAAIGLGTMNVRGAMAATQAAEARLAEVLQLEVGAHDELDALGIDPEPLAQARTAGPIHEGQALLSAMETAAKPPLAERPEARVLQQRRERIAPVFVEAVEARAGWRDQADSLLGAAAVTLGTAPAYEPIPAIEHLVPQD